MRTKLLGWTLLIMTMLALAACGEPEPANQSKPIAGAPALPAPPAGLTATVVDLVPDVYLQIRLDGLTNQTDMEAVRAYGQNIFASLKPGYAQIQLLGYRTGQDDLAVWGLWADDGTQFVEASNPSMAKFLEKAAVCMLDLATVYWNFPQVKDSFAGHFKDRPVVINLVIRNVVRAGPGGHSYIEGADRLDVEPMLRVHTDLTAPELAGLDTGAVVLVRGWLRGFDRYLHMDGEIILLDEQPVFTGGSDSIITSCPVNGPTALALASANLTGPSGQAGLEIVHDIPGYYILYRISGQDPGQPVDRQAVETFLREQAACNDYLMLQAVVYDQDKKPGQGLRFMADIQSWSGVVSFWEAVPDMEPLFLERCLGYRPDAERMYVRAASAPDQDKLLLMFQDKPVVMELFVAEIVNMGQRSGLRALMPHTGLPSITFAVVRDDPLLWQVRAGESTVWVAGSLTDVNMNMASFNGSILDPGP